MAYHLPDLKTEDVLLLRANRGDQAAVTEIYERYFPSLFQYITVPISCTFVLSHSLKGLNSP